MSRRARRTTGLTLIEMTLVIATMALLVGFAVPAVRALRKSFQTQNGVRSMVEAALSSARAMAMSRQNYVGVRFQKLCVADSPTDPLNNLLNAPQYMIFIMHDEPAKSNLANGFRAVDGMAPIKLPETMGVMDLTGISKDMDATTGILYLGQLSNATTFSIIFSPSGKVIVHPVRVRNRNGIYRPNNAAGPLQTSNDDIFNSIENICGARRGMFLQDDYPWKGTAGTLEMGLDEENSRTGFVIYELDSLRAAYTSQTPWSGYLSRLVPEMLYVSPYTGNLIAAH
jgi:type II secretory pathway pseudopilin PulG